MEDVTSIFEKKKPPEFQNQINSAVSVWLYEFNLMHTDTFLAYLFSAFRTILQRKYTVNFVVIIYKVYAILFALYKEGMQLLS